MLSTVLLARFCGCSRIMTWTGRSASAQAGMRQYRMQATVELPVEAHIEVNAPAQRNLQVHLPLIPASETGPIQEITGRDTDAILSGDFINWSCLDRKSTRLNSSHLVISYAVFCLKKQKASFVWGVHELWGSDREDVW